MAATLKSAIASATGRQQAEVVREALGQCLGRTNLCSVKGAIASLEQRVSVLERKLATLGQLVGEVMTLHAYLSSQ